MTIQCACLLRKLKRAQIHQDLSILIDYANLTVACCDCDPQSAVTVKLKWYKNSLNSILEELARNGYIEIGKLGHARVTHTGWCALGATINDAIKFTVSDVIIPIIVTVLTTLIMRKL